MMTGIERVIDAVNIAADYMSVDKADFEVVGVSERGRTVDSGLHITFVHYWVEIMDRFGTKVKAQASVGSDNRVAFYTNMMAGVSSILVDLRDGMNIIRQRTHEQRVADDMKRLHA